MVSDEKPISPGVRQCLKILSWAARNPGGIGFNELRDRVAQLPPATLSRHLKVLCEESWLKKGEGGLYWPGPAFLCAVTGMSGRPDPDGLIRPVVEKLAAETGHSAAFARWERGRLRFSLSKNMPRSYCYPDQKELIEDVFAHPFGLTALAFLPDSVVQWNGESRSEELARAFGDFEQGAERFRELLAQIRADGYYRAVHVCTRICAPVRYGNGDLAGVIGLSLLGDSEEMIPLVRSAAREIEAWEL
ncbi:MAG: hypothetical protein PQJ60_07890 [Spirochaetales bacterium]|nr:hypothetical protein [Spirochaetales bacterium]